MFVDVRKRLIVENDLPFTKMMVMTSQRRNEQERATHCVLVTNMFYFLMLHDQK